MIQYLVKRVAWAAVLFLVITFVTYIIFFVIPTGTQRSIAGRAAESVDVRRATGVSGPFYAEYGKFVWHLVHGSLGQSFESRQPVSSTVMNAAPVTASLVLGGVIVWLAIAIPIGVISALRPRSLLDRVGMVFVLVGVSAHPAWIGLVLAHVFCYSLHWTPISGYCDFFNPPSGASCGGPAQWGFHLLLPWVTFAILFAALYARMIRATLLETLSEDYVRTARAKGASEWRVLRMHVFRNALLPLVTMVGMDIGIAMGGSVFIEQVYGLPGLGRTAVAAFPRKDLPVIMGVVIFTTTAIIVFNLIVDIVYAALDPRIQVGRGGAEEREPATRTGGRPAAVGEPA